MEKLKEGKPVFNFNGKSIDVSNIDFDSSLPAFILTHPDNSVSELSLLTGAMKKRGSSSRRI